MSFQVNKIKQLWFPLAILAIIVLTVGWILAAIVYPSNVQSSDQVLITPDPPTATAVPTEVPTSTPSPIVTPNVVTSTPTSTDTDSCTYSMHFWRTNSDAWLIENIVLGNLSYTKVEAIAILESEDPNPIERLMGEFFTALLNTFNGADSAEIDSIMVEARDWLILRPHGLDLAESETLEIEAYADQLQEYNTGLIGPGLCSDEPITPTPTTTFTPQATDTSTPGPTVLFRTPTPTKKPGGGGKPKPTNPPTSEPTKPPPPPPTNTPKPAPTSTPVVPPTPAPTQKPPTQPPPAP
jgi:hypothetical protein